MFRLQKLRFLQQKLIIPERWCSSNSFVDYSDLIHSKFSSAEQNKILCTLNESNQLTCLNVAQSKLKHLENYKKRNGPFKSLNELLEVDGLSLKVLEKLCNQIITESTPPKKDKSENKRIKQLLIPTLTTNEIDHLTCAVGIHLAPVGVSWAKMTKTNEVQSWGYSDFGTLPTKMCSTDTFDLAVTILGQIPPADAYVLEGTNGMQASKQMANAYTLHMELTSMLLAVINTSRQHNKHHSLESDGIRNCVYFLRSKLPARLFKTLVGNECVSNIATVLGLLAGNSNLPCSAISVEKRLRDEYMGHSPAHKELMGQALLLIISFTDLCLHKNANSLKNLGHHNKRAE